MSPARPVYHAEIGLFFVKLRQARGWTQRQAEDIADRRKIPGFTKNIVWRLETGRIKNVEPDVLRSVAELYERPYEQVAWDYLRVRYGLNGPPSPPVISDEVTETAHSLAAVPDAPRAALAALIQILATAAPAQGHEPASGATPAASDAATKTGRTPRRVRAASGGTAR